MKKFTSVLLFLFTAVVLSAGQEYKIDPVHSSATFKVKHLMLSTVVGRFNDVSGTIVYDQSDPSKSKVEAIIKTATVNTDNSMRDGDLKNNFFEVEKYPEMRFNSTKIEKRGDQWVATGPLTIKDVTKTIEIPFDVAKADTPMGPRLGASATFKINRNDYHVVKASMADNGSVVGSDITIELNVEAGVPKPAGK
jgi:polyisoprenoid-binding protein YceI